MYLFEQRKGERPENIFSTSTFMISADQNLIAYANDNYEGVQIVVLPSVWLTIMLRFCGRAEDDYKAFVSFMTIRTNDEVLWDIYGVLEKLNGYTSDEEIKRKVITEMQHHRDIYPIENEEEYDESIKKAFDVIVAEVENNHIQNLAEQTTKLEQHYSAQMQQQKTDAESRIERLNQQYQTDREELLRKGNAEKEEAIERAKADSTIQERKRSAIRIATQKIDKRLRRWKTLNRIRQIMTIILAIGTVLVFFGWMYGWEPIEILVEKCIPQKIEQSIDSQIVYIVSIIGGIIAAVLKFLKKANEKMFSDERKKS